jgi:uncharacterized membrane protein
MNPLRPPAAASGARLHGVDAVRGAAVIVMIIVHCFAFYASYVTQEHSNGDVILDIGKLTAVFLLCMGVSSAFSRRQTPRALAVRGARLLALGYALNVLKFLVPWGVFHDLPDALVVDLGWTVGTRETCWRFLLLGDILHLAGLSLLIIAGLRAAGARPWMHVALAAAVAIAAPFVWGLRGGGPVLTYACDLLFSERFTVFFPMFPWLAYPLVGHALGDLLRRSSAPPRDVIRRWSGVGAVLVVAGVAVGVAYPRAWKGWDFYRTGPAGVAAVVGASLVFLHVAGAAWPHLPSPVQRALTYMSRNVTRIYMVSWVVICWLMGWVGFMAHPGGDVVWLTARVFVQTLLVDAILARLPGLRRGDSLARSAPAGV